MRLYLRAGPPAPLEATGTVGGVHSLGLKQWARLPEERRGPDPTTAWHPRLPAHGLLPAALLQRLPYPVALLHSAGPPSPLGFNTSASLVLSPLRTACSRLALRGSPWEEWKPGTPWPAAPVRPSRGATHYALGWWALAQLPRESPDAGWKPTCHSWLGLTKFLSSAAAPETKPWRGFGAPASQKREVIPGRPSGHPDPGQWNPHAAESTEGNSKGQAGQPRSGAEAGQAAARGPPTCLTLRSNVAGGDGPHTGALTSPGGPPQEQCCGVGRLGSWAAPGVGVGQAGRWSQCTRRDRSSLGPVHP